MAYRTWLNLLLVVALLLAAVVLLNRGDEPAGITIEARDPPLSTRLDVAR